MSLNQSLPFTRTYWLGAKSKKYFPHTYTGPWLINAFCDMGYLKSITFSLFFFSIMCIFGLVNK